MFAPTIAIFAFGYIDSIQDSCIKNMFICIECITNISSHSSTLLYIIYTNLPLVFFNGSNDAIASSNVFQQFSTET